MATNELLLGSIARLLDVLWPFQRALLSADAFEILLARHGWQAPTDRAYFPQIRTILDLRSDVEDVATVVADLVATEDPSPNAIAETLEAAVDLVERIRVLASQPIPSGLPFPLNQPEFWQTFPEELVSRLFADYLEIAYPSISALLHLLGLVDISSVPAGGQPGRIDYEKTEIRWDRLGTLVRDPAALTREVYGWGGDLDHVKLVERVVRVARALGLPAKARVPDPVLLDDYYSQTNAARAGLREARVPLRFDLDREGGFFEIGVVLVPIPPAGDTMAQPVGVLVGPYVRGRAGEAVQIGGPFVLELSGALDSELPVGVELRPELVSARASGGATELGLRAALVGRPAEPWVLLGSRGSHHLDLTDVEIALLLRGRATDPELSLAVGTSRVRVVLDFSEADGFLNSLFRAEPQAFEAAATIAWSSKTGLAFSGQGSLALTLPLNMRLGVAEIDSLTIAIVGGDGRADTTIAITGSAGIGPVFVTVDKIGVRLSLIRAERGSRAKFGDLDLDFGFKPPDGLGILIDAGPVTGGGFLNFDHANGRYAGILQLQIYSVAVTAIGLLDTKLPGGQPGFSFLIIITAEFPPIQLGFGFTLNGVGGLAGIHRTLVIDALQAGVRQGSMDHILFPEDPIRDAAIIISELRTFFPPAQGRYVFGPIALIGYGTPTLVEIELGIILEVPEPIRLILLGQMHALLPNKDTPILELHVDILGVIDFGAKSMAIDASIHDSRVAAWALYGDMAFRLTWGEPSNFALAVGGFNPHFQPPPGFPSLRRLTVALGDGENPRITLQGYFALSSATVQAGARAELYAKQGSFNVYGWVGFDALFIFTPFSFRTDFSAGIAFRRKTKTLASVHLDAILTGPSPFHAWGEACISILFLEACVDFDATFGPTRTVSAAPRNPWELLEPAVRDQRNWSSALPPAALAVVALRQPNAPLPIVILDPVGTAVFRQKVVPLNLKLAKFGEAPLAGPADQYSITQVSVDGQPAAGVTATKDLFARAQFQSLSDQQKLSLPSFERLDAGVAFASNSVRRGDGHGRDVVYETIIIDKEWDSGTKGDPYKVPLRVQQAMLGLSTAATASIRTTGLGKFAPPLGAVTRFTLNDEVYGVCTTDGLAPRAGIAEPGTQGQVLDQLQAYLAQHPDERGRYQVTPLHEMAVP